MNPYKEYEKNEVMTANPKELILMLYTGAIKLLEDATQYIKNYKTYDLANEKILKAQDIITELILSLDMEKGKEIAANLFSLYSFMKKELLNANIKKEVDPIQNVIKFLSELKSSWEQIDVQPSSSEKDKSESGFNIKG